MKRLFNHLPGWLAIGMLGLALGLTGCGGDEQSSAGNDSSNTGSANSDESGLDGGEKQTDSSNALDEAMAALSADDRASATAQATCPVSEEPLGSMGTPLKITVSDRDVWICCDSCEDALLGDPETYFAKLDQ